MSFDISWLVEGKVMRLTLEGSLSEKQLAGLDDRMIRFLKTGTALMVHIVIDGEHLMRLPSINDLSRLRALGHPRAGWVVTTGVYQKPILKNAFTLLAQILKFRHSEALEVEDALIFLSNIDPTLTDTDVTGDLAWV